MTELLLRLGEAQQLTIDAPDEGMPKLEAVLLDLQALPQALASDLAAQQARVDALLVLARAKLKAGDQEGAAAYLDEAIRCAHGGDINAASLGPSMARLEADRTQAMSARGTLRVRCTVPCDIYVDERGFASEGELPQGQYRVHVRSKKGQLDALDTTVQVRAGDAPIELQYGPVYGPADIAEPEPARSAPTDLQADAPQLSARTGGRILPRWLEVTGLVLGGAGVAAGGTLLALDGRCQGAGSVAGSMPCDNLYSTEIAGFSALGAGAAVLLGSGILLTVDELRVRKGQLSSINLSAAFRF